MTGPVPTDRAPTDRAPTDRAPTDRAPTDRAPTDRVPTDTGPAPATDADILRAHVRGDPQAFAELVRRHRDRLWAVALRTLGDPEEAADALQDALLSAFRRAETFRGDAAVTTWLHRIVVNACLDRVRRRRARPTQPLPDDPDREEADEREPDVADRTAVALDVRAALATLPVEQRAALVLVDLQGFSVADAAEVLQCPVGTVKSRCARARARLAPLLAHLAETPVATSPTDPVRVTSPDPGHDGTAGARPRVTPAPGRAPGVTVAGADGEGV